MASPSGWADLPEDILRKIFEKLPGAIDRAMGTLLCPYWRSVSMTITQSPLPLLLMAEGDRISCRRVALGARALPLPDVIAWRGARFLGACGQSFAVEVAEHARRRTGRYALVGFEGQATALPDSLRVPFGGRSFDMRIHTVVGGPDYFAAIVTSTETTIAFWGVGVGETPYWTPPVFPDFRQITYWRCALPPSPVDDVVQANGAFFVLTSKEGLHRYEPVISQGVATLTMRKETVINENRLAPDPSGHTVARYLCYVRGAKGAERFVLIRRYVLPGHGTVNFEVLWSRVQGNDDGGPPTTRWSKLSHIRGSILFIGRGCSRSILTGRPCKGYIYFVDDARFRDIQAGPYPRSDTGSLHYDEEAAEPTAIEFEQPSHPPSISSPSIWF